MNERRMWKAVQDRDSKFDGLFFFAVKTTGVFCRPVCRSRLPLRENVEYFETADAAKRAGYRACLRCRPESLATDALVESLARLDAPLTDAELRARGIDPSTARRRFQKRFGVSFQKFQRQKRIARGTAQLRLGAKVIEAQQACGFESGSGFRRAVKSTLGSAPALRPAALIAAVIPTPLGEMIAVARAEGLALLAFRDEKSLPSKLKAMGPLLHGEHPVLEETRAWLAAYFAGRPLPKIPLAALGTTFQNRVWQALVEIPRGQTRSYQRLASEIGAPGSVRAVARANAQNPIALIVPCHRVIGADGKLRGYAGGVHRKAWLLAHERVSETTAMCAPSASPDRIAV